LRQTLKKAENVVETDKIQAQVQAAFEKLPTHFYYSQHWQHFSFSALAII
jgi:hypothetical protein